MRNKVDTILKLYITIDMPIFSTCHVWTPFWPAR